MAVNGRTGSARRIGAPWSALVLLCALAGVVRSAACSPLPVQRPQDASASQDLERLRTMLASSGPDGRDARDTAIARLVAMPDVDAHRVLQERLLVADDVDGVRESILKALGANLLGSPSAIFGGAGDVVRRQIHAGYVATLAMLWTEPGHAIDDAIDNPVRAAARTFLQRVPAQELDSAARAVLGTADAEVRGCVLRCLADMQQVVLAQTMADWLEDPEEPVRRQARRSLQLLTCHDEEFQTKAQFAVWFERNRSARYVDLVERAARLGPRPLERLREELAKLRVDAARDVVRALTARSPGIDWTSVQARTLVDEPSVLDACLDQLQRSLGSGIPAEDQAAARQVFCRALLQRFAQVAPDQARRRALLLEVSAYLVRTDELELAAEVTTQLLGQLEARSADVQLAALRGLRRFPSVEVRTRLVRFAQTRLASLPDSRETALTTLATLASRSAPRWAAPGESDLDKAEWLALVAAACRVQGDNDIRSAGLNLAQTLDAKDARVPQAFGVLLELAKDATQDPKFRSTCMIQLQGWRGQSQAAEDWVRAMHDLLRDPSPELRQQAAESLTRLPESVEQRRGEWIVSTILVVKERLAVETTASVQRALVDCLLACGREPQMPERAIGALIELLSPSVTPETQLRSELLLQALAAVAADSHAELGQWLAACRRLLVAEKRQSLRLVLQGHGAVDLARSVASDEPGLATSARYAMQCIIGTALLKPAKDPWTSSDELKREAFEVRSAFAALDGVDEPDRLDDTRHRILRLEVDLALGKHLELVERANGYLANGGGSNGNGGNGAAAGKPEGKRTPMTPAERDRVRVLAAEAQLALGKPELAARVLTEVRAESAKDAAVTDLQSRIARAWFPIDSAGAVALFAASWRATPPEDPQFRARLVDWMTFRLRLEPTARAEVLQEVAPFAPQFDRADCAPELRDAFRRLHDAR